MTTPAAPAPADWPALIRAAFARQKRGLPVDLGELLSSPEAMAARGLTAALMDAAMTTGDRRRVADAFVRDDLPSFWNAGHGGEDGPHDLHVMFRPAERVVAMRSGPEYQTHLLRRYCDWRREGRDGPRPADTSALDPRLIAVANMASASEIHELVDDLGPPGPLRRERVAEYREIGIELLTDDPGLARPAPGPAAGLGLPRRSWQPAPANDQVQLVDEVGPPAGGATDLADDAKGRTP